jgi:protein-histidine pros-kinase
LRPNTQAPASVRRKKGYREHDYSAFPTPGQGFDQKHRHLPARDQGPIVKAPDFFSFMSHELRAPLNGVIGFAELLSDEKAGELNVAQKEFLEDILADSRHLLHLISGVIEKARLEAGQNPVYPEPFAPAIVIRETCAGFSALLAARAVSLTVTVSPGLQVCLDRRKFQQLVYRLVSNAIRHAGAGGRIDLEFSRKDAAWQLEVSDSGPGIVPSDLAHLFEDKSELESRGLRRNLRSGLGLPLMRRLVELQGGSIVAHSVPGQGSVFKVSFPVPQGAAS